MKIWSKLDHIKFNIFLNGQKYLSLEVEDKKCAVLQSIKYISRYLKRFTKHIFIKTKQTVLGANMVKSRVSAGWGI